MSQRLPRLPWRIRRWFRYQKASGLWRFCGTLMTFRPRGFLFTLVLMVFASLTEGVGILMLVPLLQVVGVEVGQGAVGYVAGFAEAVFRALGRQPTLVSVLAIYVVLVALRAQLHRWQGRVGFVWQSAFVLHLRETLYAAVVESKWLFFVRERSSDFSHALTHELDRVDAATGTFLALVVQLLIGALYVVLALQVSVPLTILMFTCGISLMLLFREKITVRHKLGEEISHSTQGLYAAASEHLASMKMLKSHALEGRFKQAFGVLCRRLVKTEASLVRNYHDLKFAFTLGSTLLLALMLYLSFEILSMSPAGVLLLLFLFSRIIPIFSATQSSYQALLSDLPAFEGVIDLHMRCVAAAEPPADRVSVSRPQHAIRFRRVSFRYQAEQQGATLSNLDINFDIGKTTALVGPSGAGKSTVVDMLVGLIAPECGEILFDEVPVTLTQMTAWRQHIAYVAQDTFLFHDTVRANLSVARPSTSDEEILGALHDASAADFVNTLPHGLDTLLGDRGVRLSGGERQRLALARALLRRPELLILDEATSALDAENEQRIQDAIERLQGRMTIVVIAHRLATVRRADVIYVLDAGRVVERGDWTSLSIKPQGRFKALYQAQAPQDADRTLSDTVSG